MLIDVAYVGNKADDLLLRRELQPGRPPTARRRTSRSRRGGRFRRSATSPTSSTAASRATRRSRRSTNGGWAAEITLLSSLTLSQGEGQRRPARSRTRTATSRRRRISTISTPTSGCRRYHQPYNSTTSFVVVAAVRPRQTLGQRHRRRRSTSSPAAGSSPASTRSRRARWSRSSTRRRRRSRCRRSPTTSGARTTIGRTSPATRTRRRVSSRSRSWFNPACVVAPTDQSQPFGNAPRNNVRGPNFWQFDLAAIKNVALGGQARPQLRLEAFNLFNRVNFTPPAANRSIATFGTITSTFDQRAGAVGRESALVEPATGNRHPTDREPIASVRNRDCSLLRAELTTRLFFYLFVSRFPVPGPGV